MRQGVVLCLFAFGESLQPVVAVPWRRLRRVLDADDWHQGHDRYSRDGPGYALTQFGQELAQAQTRDRVHWLDLDGEQELVRAT